MIRRKAGDIIVGLDVGTNKICTVVAERDNNDVLTILTIGHAPSQGLRKGVVVNVEKTVEAIEKSVAQAEEAAGVEINSVFAGIAGGHIQSVSSQGIVPIAGNPGEITEEDIRKVHDAAKAISLPPEREIIHVIPQEYRVDGQGGILEPKGMIGTRLEASVNIITASVASVQNIVKSINQANIDVSGIILQPIASSEATLKEEEKESGVVLIDIGGGTTDYAIFIDGSLRHSGVLAIGGDHVTNDIKIRFNIPSARAEDLKKKFGCALSEMVGEHEEFILPGTFGYPARSMLRKDLSEVINARMSEILEIIKAEIDATEYSSQVGAGIVMTGGASLMPGTIDLASHIFHVPVRLGVPRDVLGLNDNYQSPIYSTGVGLVLFGLEHFIDQSYTLMDDPGIVVKVLHSMREMVQKYF